jgi:hypothetical protein
MKPLLVPLLLAAGLIAGCENHFEAITAPPPGLTASLDDQSKSIRLSRGVSIAFSCASQEGDPCGRTSSTQNATTARIFPAALDDLTEWGYLHGPQPQSVFVVVGIAEGNTEVRAGGDSLSVTVLP